VEITLPHLPDIVVTMEDMSGKVPKLKYVDHEITDTMKFQDFAQEVYMENRGEVGPLGKPILEPAQSVIGLYNSGVKNLLDILHFWHGKNVGLCMKKLFSMVHGGIMWMDRSVP